jgi:hypothetical protein
MFSIPRVNVIASDQGFSVEVLGRVGLRYEEGGKTIFVDSEVLAPNARACMIIWPSRMDRWDPPHADEAVDEATRQRIVDRIREAFRFRGLEIEVDGQPGPDSNLPIARPGKQPPSPSPRPIAS